MLSTSAETLDENGRLALNLRKAILNALRGNYFTAHGSLNELEQPRAASNNPWFRGDVRYWRLVVNHWLGEASGIEEIAAAERDFPNWRSRLRLADLKFEFLMRQEEYALAKVAADDIDRL